MNINKIKNFVIIILVIAAVYQTGLLWLEDTASHNFFYTIFGLESQKEFTAEGNALLLPSKFVIGSGNKKYTLAYASDIEKEAVLSEGNNLLQEVLTQGTASATIKSVNWDNILENKCLLLEYHFFVPMEEYFENYNKKLLTPALESFNCIAIVPNKTNNGTTNVYFINTNLEQSCNITIEKSRFSADLYTMLEQKENYLTYVSTKQSGFNLFCDNVFAPQWKEESFPYSSIIEINPFMKDGSINRYFLENSVDSFFKNLESDWNRVDETGTFIFSDENVVVRYYPKGILEYYSYGTYDTEAVTNITTGYQICKNFMNNDTSLKTEVYLSGIEMNRNEVIYYFDYTVDNYPILLSEAVQNDFEMSHAIEISVRGNSVRKYKRYAHNFKAVDVKDKQISVEFLEALDQAIEQYKINHKDSNINEVEDMYLGYFVEPDFVVTMKWITELYDELYIGKTIKDKT